MRRAALIVAAVTIAAALAIVATRPSSPTPTSPTQIPTTLAEKPRPVPRISRADVMAQRDELSAVERGRVRRTRLLDATLVTAAAAHRVSIVAGQARSSGRDPQDMVVTPDPGLTVREIATAVSRICAALGDPCERGDYRFLIQTPSGQALLPAHLLEPTKKD